MTANTSCDSAPLRSGEWSSEALESRRYIRALIAKEQVQRHAEPPLAVDTAGVWRVVGHEALVAFVAAVISGLLVGFILLSREQSRDDDRADREMRHTLAAQLAVKDDLVEIVLAGHDMEGIVLAGRDLTGANLDGTNLRWSSFNGKRVESFTHTHDGVTHSHSEQFNTGATLTLASFESADLTGSILVDVDLGRATLVRATLSQADLTNARLQDADLTDANLTGANFTGSTLSRASFVNANLSSADFSNSMIDETNFDGAWWEPGQEPRWPEDQRPSTVSFDPD